MRRILLIILMLCAYFYPANFAEAVYNADLPKNLQIEDEEDPILPNIFIWQIPDSDLENLSDYSKNISDGEELGSEEEVPDHELYLSNYDNIPLKGYLDYLEDYDAISLKKNDEDFVLNLSVPQKFETASLSDIEKKKLPATSLSKHFYARSSEKIHSNIAPLRDSHEISHGAFSFGTSYNEGVEDSSDLEFSTSFYTKYENKYFALKSSYDKGSGVAYSDVIDKFSFAPELKLNPYISVRDVLTSDITRNRRKNEIILSIKPTADDRVRFEFGAGNIYDADNSLMKTQVKFSTKFKW